VTFDQFIAELKTLVAEGKIKFRRRHERDEDCDWVLIRTADDKDECPICALHNYKFPDARVGNTFWKQAARKMELDEDLGAIIINCADDINMPTDSKYLDGIATAIKSLAPV
jgi:hypothetical protein